MAKRLFDLLVACLLLVILFPAGICVALLVRLFLGPGVIYSQPRCGRDEAVFNLFKFRSMTDLRQENGALAQDALRLNGFGKLLRASSLDELPSLINVLLGDMSLVGPRPLLVEYLPLYSEEQRRRHEVRPGITGWAQVNGRNAISWEQKFALDVWYVDNMSFLLDLRILFQTAWKVLRAEGVSQSGHVTSEKFRGA